ncbi:MAG: alpha-L-glutamate ligase [Gammaproteobacteria bacterium]|nr:alpha-L-glutamate ligase [Gammaproteobacteria bacterium]
MSSVYLLHENPEWIAPLERALDVLGTQYEVWDISAGSIDLAAPPPPGVFYCRMSASAHTRGHPHAAQYASAVLQWLEHHQRRVVNGSRSILLEVSKVRQYMAMTAAGIRVPHTRVAVGREHVMAAADGLPYPLIVKPNQGGKGLGVQKFESRDALETYVDSDELDAGPDGTLLVQEYIQPAEPFIVRNEFVAGKHLYSVRVDTTDGFELCPADACAIDDVACPVGENASARFEILGTFSPPEIQRYEALLANHGIEVAGIEMIFGADGNTYTYDINVNTNYNEEAEALAGFGGTARAGMGAVAKHLTALLHQAMRSAA